MHDRGETLSVTNVERLTDVTWRIRQALTAHGITGALGAEIDHIELFGAHPTVPRGDSKSFVLCPGRAYDRSPCGTGGRVPRSPVFFADGKLAEEGKGLASGIDHWQRVPKAGHSKPRRRPAARSRRQPPM